MPEQGYYEKLPRPESISTFIQYVENCKLVEKVIKENEQIITVLRINKRPLRVFMTNIYIVSIADVYDITSQNKNLDAIVTMSAWNGYTNEAKVACQNMGMGLFKFKEFLGAVYFDGKKFIDYVPPKEH